jgi:hypothetical protein
MGTKRTSAHEDQDGGFGQDNPMLNLSALAADVLSSIDLSSVPTAPTLIKGMQVEVRYGGGCNYFRGRIVRARAKEEGTPELSFDVLYEAGDKEFKVPPNLIRPFFPEPESESAPATEEGFAHLFSAVEQKPAATSRRRRRSNTASVCRGGLMSLWAEGKDLNPPALSPINSARRRLSLTGSCISSIWSSGSEIVFSIHDEDDLFPTEDALACLERGCGDECSDDDGGYTAWERVVDLETIKARARVRQSMPHKTALARRSKMVAGYCWRRLLGKPAGEEQGRLGYSERESIVFKPRTGIATRLQSALATGSRLARGCNSAGGEWDKTCGYIYPDAEF